MAKGGGFAELETELALRRKLAREASRKAQLLSQECQTLSAALEEAKSAASRFEKRAAAAEKIAANAISHAEVEEERHAAWTAELTERCEALAEELRAANESRDAAVKKVEALELRLSDIASDGASATNTRPNTPSPVKGENDPAELVTVEETAEPASEVSEVRLSINVVDVASHEREDHLLARAELAESAVAELRAKLESANVRVAAAEDELRAARKTVEETAKTVQETAEETAKTTEELRTRVNALDAALGDAKDEADAYRSALADAEAKLVSSAEAEKLNHQSLVRRVDAAEKDLADALARCADMSERRDAAELRARARSRGGFRLRRRRREPRRRAGRGAKSRGRQEGDGRRQEGRRGRGGRAGREARSRAHRARGRARARGRSRRFRERRRRRRSRSRIFPQRRRRTTDRRRPSRKPVELVVPADPGPARSSPARPPNSSRSSCAAASGRRSSRLTPRSSACNWTRPSRGFAGPAPSSKIRAGKFAERDASADSGAGSALARPDADPAHAALASELAEYKAKCAHLRSMLDAKEEALEEVERRPDPRRRRRLRSPPPPPPRRRRGPRPSRRSPRVPTRVPSRVPWTRLSWRLRWRSDSPRWDPSSRRGAEPSRLRSSRLALSPPKSTSSKPRLRTRAENRGRTGTTTNGGGSQRRSARFATPRTSSPPRCSRRRIPPGRISRPISKTKRMPLGVAADAAVARLAYLAKRAEVHESETRGSSKRRRDANRRDARGGDGKGGREARRARARSRRAPESEGRSRRRRAVGGGEGERGGGVREVRRRPSRRGAHRGGAEGARPAGDSRERDQGGQARALMLQAECSELRAKVEKRNREVRELNQMLKAWEAMRHSKDQQIAQLVERCRKFEEEAADKARAIDAMRSRLGRDGQPGGASVGAGSVGSVSFNRTPRRSPTGTSMRLSPSPAPSSVSSFAFGTRAPSGGAAPSPVNVDQFSFGDEEVRGDGGAGRREPRPAGRRGREGIDRRRGVRAGGRRRGREPEGWSAEPEARAENNREMRGVDDAGASSSIGYGKYNGNLFISKRRGYLLFRTLLVV